MRRIDDLEPRAHTTLRGRSFDRTVHTLFACVLFLALVFLWHRSYERSCLALAFPALTALAIFGGVLEYRLERRRFAVDYYLDRRSFLHRRLQRTWWPISISLAATVPLAAFLVVFAALSRPTDWLFLGAAAAVAPLAFHALSCWPGRHFRRDPGDGERRTTVADILVARVAGTLVLAGVTGAYLYASYYLIPVPGQDIYPDSLELTLEAFSARGRSACPVVEDTLLLAAQVEGLSWYFVTTAATSEWVHDGMRLLLWAGFFLNAAVVFGAFVRGLEGSILLACRIVGPARSLPADGRDTSGAAPPAPAKRAGRATWAWRTVLVVMSATLLSIVVGTAWIRPFRYTESPMPPEPPDAPLPECDRLRDSELERLGNAWWTSMAGRLSREPLPLTERVLQDNVDAAFAPVYARIPEFVDWHYSLAGQYTQLAQAIPDQLLASQFARAALERLQDSRLVQAALDRLRESQFARAALERWQDSALAHEALEHLERLRQATDSRLFAGLPDRVRHASAGVETVMREEMRDLIARRMRDEVRTVPTYPLAGAGAPCTEVGTAGLRMVYESMLTAAMPDAVRRFTASAPPTGLLAAGAAARGAVAGRTLIKGLSARLMTRTAGRTASALGAAAGGLAAGAAAWLIVDVAVLVVDEHFNRDALERELIELVDEQKAAMKTELARAVDEARSAALGAITPSEMNRPLPGRS